MAGKKRNLDELKNSRKTWPQPAAGSLDISAYTKFLLRKQAVDMYIDGAKVMQIQKTTGIPACRVGALVDECTGTGENGELIGYCGLLGSKHNSAGKTERRSGEFTKLLDKHPSLKEFILGNYFGDKKYTSEKNMSLITLHGKFIAECRRLGVMQHEYPFSTLNQGYVSLCAYVHHIEEQNLQLQMRRSDKDNAQKLASTGIGERYCLNPLYPFSAVQVDGHIIDMLYTVEIPNDDGSVSRIVATRAWLIAVIDIATRCILGYAVSQEYNYNQYDVMDAVKDAVIPKTLKELSISGIAYPSNGGFYSTAFSELKNAMFDSIMLDNAKAHLSSFTLSKLADELKCTVNFGSVSTPETRGIVERFFGTLESRGFHKLPMTTGSSADDLKRKSPEKNALKYEVTYDQIVEIMDVLIAEYNNTPNKGIDNLTPLECMRIKVFDAGMMPYTADIDEYAAVINRLNMRMDTRYVKGHVKKGKRAYIQFMGVEYRSRLLSSSEVYINQKIQILYDPRDISTVEAYTMDGIYIDTLTARGEFGTKSHSIKTSQLVLKLARERGRNKCEFDTPIEAYVEHLKKTGKRNRRAATRSDIVRREIGRPAPSETVLSDNIIHFEQATDSDKKLTSEDIKGLNPQELYSLLFEERRN